MPKSIRHKRILDVAEDNPNASIEEIAAEISSVTADTVENVLDEYGDPADANEVTPTPPNEDTTDGLPSGITDLSPAQRETIEAIHKNPEATQRELGEILDVSQSTINNRVNTIPQFNWEKRITLTARLIDTIQNSTQTIMQKTEDTQAPVNSDSQEPEMVPEDQSNPGTSDQNSLLEDPEFAYKIFRACIDSETLSEEEERRLFIELQT